MAPPSPKKNQAALKPLVQARQTRSQTAAAAAAPPTPGGRAQIGEPTNLSRGMSTRLQSTPSGAHSMTAQLSRVIPNLNQANVNTPKRLEKIEIAEHGSLTTDQMIQMLSNIPNPLDRFTFALSLKQTIITAGATADHFLTCLYDWTHQHPINQEIMKSKENRDCWQDAQARVRAYKDNEGRAEQARKAILTLRPELDSCLPYTPEVTTDWLEKFRAMVKKLEGPRKTTDHSSAHIVLAIGHAMLERLQTRFKGHRLCQQPMSGDLSRAAQLLLDSKTPITLNKVRDMQNRLGPPDTFNLWRGHTLMQNLQKELDNPNQEVGRTMKELPPTPRLTSTVSRSQRVTISRPLSSPSAPSSPAQSLSATMPSNPASPTQQRSLPRSVSQSTYTFSIEGSVMSVDPGIRSLRDVTPAGSIDRPSTSLADLTAGDIQVKRLNCNCRGVKPNIQIATDGKARSQRDLLIILKRAVEDGAIFDPDGGSNRSVAKSSPCLCYKHTQALASQFGLYTQRRNHSELFGRLFAMNQHRVRFGDFKVHRNYYTWFRKAARPVMTVDHHGHWRFVPLLAPDNALLDPLAGITKWQALQELYLPKMGPDVETEFPHAIGYVDPRWSWGADGSIVIDTMFDFIFQDPEWMALIDQEWEMYSYHMRRQGKAQLGWNRVMVHSLVQQLVRQTPAYWFLYVLLRSDHNWRLISYPYYTKHAYPGDSTGFWHIDMNVPQMIRDQRGINAIQGSLSFDDEEEPDCTFMWLRMHKHIKEWWEELQDISAKSEKHKLTDGHVHRMDDFMNTDELQRKYGGGYKAQPCKRGGVRISDPRLPHGAKGPTRKERRTILPWFVGIQGDGQTVDTVESDTVDDIAYAHRAMLNTMYSPSAKINSYGNIKYAFPAAVQLTGLGPISDALVGRVDWRCWEPTSAAKRAFTHPSQPGQGIQAIMEEWVKVARPCYFKAYGEQKRGEMASYGEKSYYYRVEKGLTLEIDDDVPDDLRSGIQEPDDEGWYEIQNGEQGIEEDFAEHPGPVELARQRLSSTSSDNPSYGSHPQQTLPARGRVNAGSTMSTRSTRGRTS